MTSDPTILPDFSIYMERYLPVDIKREEFTLLYSIENVYVFQVEYITSVLEYDKDIDYSKSKSYVGGYSLLEDVKVRIYKILLIIIF